MAMKMGLKADDTQDDDDCPRYHKPRANTEFFNMTPDVKPS